MTLKDYEHDLYQCPRCSMCKWIPPPMSKSWRFARICPSHLKYVWDAYSAQGRLSIAYRLVRGELDWCAEGLSKIIYACTMCRACDVMCKLFEDMETGEILLELRAEAVERGIGPMPEHKRFTDWTDKEHNPYMEKHVDRLKWVPKAVEVAKKADTAYFVGCTSSYRRTEIAEATVKTFNTIGVDFMLLHPEEWCCGSPMYRTGQRKLFIDLMKHNVEAIRKAGVKRVITSCAGCYETFKVNYPRFLGENLGFEVLSTVEFLNTLIKEGKLKLTKEVPIKVTYHDPCHLGRNSEPYIPWKGEYKKFGIREPPKELRRGTYGVYDPPREVLKAIPGIELVEMERIREYAFCCGGGGGVKAAFPDLALFAAGERIEEAKTTGAEAIVSCCPFCATNFKDAIRERKEKIGFYDITELILKAIT